MRSANNGSVLGTVTSQPFHTQFVFQPGAPVRLRRFCPFLLPIYRMFMAGKNPTAIARHLTQQKIPTPGGKEN